MTVIIKLQAVMAVRRLKPQDILRLKMSSQRETVKIEQYNIGLACIIYSHICLCFKASLSSPLSIIIIAGIDQTGVQLYQVDPSGTFFRGAGFAIGQYSDIALDVLQREYSADMNIEQAIQLGNKAIEKALGERPLVETGIVTAKDGSFRKLVNN